MNKVIKMKYTAEELAEQFVNNELDFNTLKEVPKDDLLGFLAEVEGDIITRWGDEKATEFVNAVLISGVL